MGLAFRPAYEAEKIGLSLIQDHYPDIEDSECKVRYIFRNEHAKSNGRQIYGTCKKVGGETAYMAEYGWEPPEGPIEPKDVAFYRILLAEDLWRTLTSDERVALVDHELAHILVTPDEKGGWSLKIQGHDIEDFAAIVRRHGLWSPSLVHFARTTDGKMALPFDGDNDG